MNRTTKIGLTILGIGIFLNIGERLAWPPIRAIPLGDPLQLPFLYALGACLIISPIMIFVGLITALTGFSKQKS